MYKQGDNVLLKNEWKTKFNQDAYIVPFRSTAVRKNGTVMLLEPVKVESRTFSISEI